MKLKTSLIVILSFYLFSCAQLEKAQTPLGRAIASSPLDRCHELYPTKKNTRSSSQNRYCEEGIEEGFINTEDFINCYSATGVEQGDIEFEKKCIESIYSGYKNVQQKSIPLKNMYIIDDCIERVTDLNKNAPVFTNLLRIDFSKCIETKIELMFQEDCNPEVENCTW
jgi:hypothetical protein